MKAGTLNKAKNIFLYILVICTFVAFAACCKQIDKVPALGEGEVIKITQGTVTNFGELRIGLGKVIKGDYTNDAGEEKHGLVGILFVFISGKPPQEKRFDVYAGQNVRMGKYSVFVQEVRRGLKGSVTLVVKEDSPEATTIDLTELPPNWTEEVLMGLFANGNEFSIRVKSGGCTKKEDFWIWCVYDEKSKDKLPHYILTIYRMREDQGKALIPSGVIIKYNLKEELGLPYLFTYSVTNKVEGKYPMEAR
jgi:hypothetical protein